MVSSVRKFFGSQGVTDAFVVGPNRRGPRYSTPSYTEGRPGSTTSFSAPSDIIASYPSVLTTEARRSGQSFPSVRAMRGPRFIISRPRFALLRPESHEEFGEAMSTTVSILAFFPFEMGYASVLFLLHVVFVWG